MTSDKWRMTKIKDLGRVITGKTPSSENPEHFGDSIPFITPSDMDGRRVIDKPSRYLSEKGASALSRLIVPRGVGVSCIGWQMGKSVLIPQPSVTNQQINSVIPNEEIVDNLFLYYALTPRRNEFFRLAAGGSRTPILKKSDFEQLPFLLPPLNEQKAIAHILGTLDDKIELNQQMNRTLEAIARALFKSWFIDFDPVRAKLDGRQPAGMDAETATLFPAEFEDGGAIGKIPKGWKIEPLDQIADFLNGLALQKYPPEGDDYLPVIKIAELRKGITESSGKASPNIDKKYIIQDGDILFSWSGSLEALIWCGGTGALNQHLFKVTSKKYPKWFYYEWVKSHLFDFQAIAASKATTMGHIQRHHLTAALGVIAPDQLMKVADEKMSPLLEKFIANNLESRSLTSLRDALLPKLLSGETTINNAEKVLEAVR